MPLSLLVQTRAASTPTLTMSVHRAQHLAVLVAARRRLGGG